MSGALSFLNTVLRRFRRWSLQDQEHPERRQESQALGGPVGQTEYVTLQWRERKETDDSRDSLQAFTKEFCEYEAGQVHRGLTSTFAVMDRDRRLTGYLRGQVDQPTAPAGFEVSNGWRVSYTICSGSRGEPNIVLIDLL